MVNLPWTIIVGLIIHFSWMLPLKPYPQITNQWCWAAAGKMILDYLDPAHQYPECAIVRKSAEQVGDTLPCCAAEIPHVCIFAGAMNWQLFGWGYQGSIIPDPFTLRDILDTSPVQSMWRGNSNWSHYLVAFGYSGTGNRQMNRPTPFIRYMFFIVDPEYGLVYVDSVDQGIRHAAALKAWQDTVVQLITFDDFSTDHDSASQGYDLYGFTRVKPVQRQIRRGPFAPQGGGVTRGPGPRGMPTRPVAAGGAGGSANTLERTNPYKYQFDLPINPSPKLPTTFRDRDEEKLALKIATEELHTLPEFLDSSKCKLLGFDSVIQVQRATLDPEPFARYEIERDNLALNLPVDKPRKIAYVIEVDGRPRSAVQLYHSATGWKLAGYGPSGFARHLFDTRERASKDLGIDRSHFFSVQIPELSTDLLGVVDTRSGLLVAPLGYDDYLQFPTGKNPVPYRDLYGKLAATMVLVHP